MTTLLNSIQGILLRPRAGDPDRILRPGPCGAQPPTAFLVDGIWYPGQSTRGTRAWISQPEQPLGGPPRALALMWRGLVVPMACAYLPGRPDLEDDIRGALTGFKTRRILQGLTADMGEIIYTTHSGRSMDL